MNKKNFYSFHSQLSLPFLESDESILEKVFSVLETKYNLEKGSEQKFIDLGAGTGLVVIYCVLNYSIYSKGIEINSHLIEEFKELIQKLKRENKHFKKKFNKIHIEHGDLFEANLEEYDFIYIFSLPTMQKYLNHVFKTAKNGAIFISYKYPFMKFGYLKKVHQIDIKIKQSKISVYFYKKL